MAKVEHRDFGTPDELREFASGHADILNTGVGTIGRLVLEPGWQWSTSLKEVAGTEFDATPGQLTYLPAGHDAWVVGDENVVVVDWHGAAHYAEA